ncbi:Eco57I restriction-modification methylase domain-containing protein [Patescibacteria group bacterium]|nr:Eco57I restriction-modification methylase domain-containing protein [Patescibacteria group bacterium]
MLSLQELKTLWNKEKKEYRSQEVGSGVQKFIKEALQSPNLFSLKECPLSKKSTDRKMEFIHEKKTKDRRRADFVIYVDMNIIIPVEVESFGKIEVGAKQLAQYQKDLEKKYGILTDGHIWRFYTDNVFMEFNIDEILKNPELFLEYWKEYIKPETYYLQFFEAKGQLKLLKQDKLLVESYRPLFFENITELIRKLQNKLQLEGYFKDVDQKEKKKKATEITYAYIIQFILYKTLVDNDFGNFGKEYKLKVNKIYQCLKEKNYTKILGIIDGISNEISKNVYRPFAKEQEFIREKLLQLYRETENKLSDVSHWLDIFVFIKKFSFENVRNEIFGFIYENYLKELFEDTKKGQYFTDPAIVNFMIKQIGYSAEDLKERILKGHNEKLSIIDPSCGSGTFLYSAVNEIIEAVPNGSEKSSKLIEDIVVNNVFGLDIEEFPLYLAEMNIIMRMLPLIINEKFNNPIDKKIKVFKTKDSISEFIDSGLKNTIHDIDVAGGQQTLFDPEKLNLGYDSFMRDEGDIGEMKKSMRPPRRRFDFVIGNPPYVSFKECSKQKVLFMQLMKLRKIKMSDIYGVNLHSTPNNHKKYAPNPNLYVFFIALGLAFLKDMGKLCYIIPQTILNAGDLDVVRYHLAKFTTIEKIIIFSGKMFVGRGLKQKHEVATSSLIFIVRREKPSGVNQVEIINYQDSKADVEVALDNILKGKKIKKKKIKQDDLLTNHANWNFIKHDKLFLDFYNEYKRKTDSTSIYYDHVWAEIHLKSKFYFDRGIKYPKNKIKIVSEMKSDNFYYISKNIKDGHRAIASNLAIDKKLLDFPFGSQGDIVYQKKYKIVWSYINYDRFRFSQDNIMINYNNVLISSDNKDEILYLLSLLNSKMSIKIFDSLLRSENEKDILIGIKTIKEFIRVPKITEDNQFIKDEVIKRSEEMLKLEDVKLSDFVDFKKVLMQKFDNVKTEKNKNKLVLINGDKEIKLEIKSNADLVKKAISGLVSNEKLRLEKNKINLGELKELPVIDFELRDKIKDYIDDLVFALYFNVSIGKVGFGRAKVVKEKCRGSKFYKVIEKKN